ncbi:lysophospholipase, alpha/beta hydrolase superfamily [Thermococcus kodakarensis KOD1]|uniref:Lysophospholipase, alpha/beta hydrolase superfamily n=1 Tax=Thermococcus kodakarensis (strain ATCC BAA-918 / JCM 12380 / KOD1) TaxID=69014 RepID=Q5JIE9_THEKO|nr:alpha/beta hydrolase [Thermococcus kodakarensis]WCN28971.1 lysophospholipase [Thermococcus kodakarensis]WCN31277.1 lysophospholipase [Thermococcus kodakarensis]BAD85188.1 lysophospholipase, alpha/beta hydrolase superfamily [Thermococcus kodakarensis KOD1]
MEIYKAKFGNPERGWVVLVHGLGEHSGRYGKLISMLNEAGFAVYTFDWPGHGKSPGKRGHTSVEEAMEIIDSIIKELGEKPFLFGHSLGGLTVIRYAETRPDKIRGVVASSPALAKSPKTPGFMVALAKVLGRIAPGLTLSNGIDPNLLSRNPDAVKRYIEDPLVHDRISTKLGMSIFKNMELAHREADRIEVPILLLVGTGDVITPPEGSRKLFEELKVKDKEIREFEGAYHEIFEDPEWGEEFHKTIVEWLIKHSEKA